VAVITGQATIAPAGELVEVKAQLTSGWGSTHDAGAAGQAVVLGTIVAPDSDAAITRDARWVWEQYLRQDKLPLGSLDGSFAVVIHDRTKGNVVLATDRFATHPLFYYVSGNSLHFSSDIGLLAKRTGASADPEAIVEFLWRQGVMAPRTFFVGIRAVPPATCVQLPSGEAARYWVPKYRPSCGMELSDAMMAVWSALRRVLSCYAKNALPTYTTCSGGVDSTTVLSGCIAERLDFRALICAIDWGDTSWNEAGPARQVTQALGIDAVALVNGREELGAALDAHLAAMVQPTPLGFGVTLLSRGVMSPSVCITGLGADELLFGYPEVTERGRGKGVEEGVRGYVAATSLFPEATVERWARAFGVGFEDVRHRVYDGLLHACRASGAEDGLAAGRTAYLEHFLCSCDLPSFGQFSAPHGVSMVYPFLSASVVDAILGIPLPLCTRHGKCTSKPLLRLLLRELGLPKQVWCRPKHGFGIPVSDLSSRLPSSRASLPEPVLKDVLKETGDSRQALCDYRKWAVEVLELWYSQVC
jgi:asparagine synthetase B (glutamine-hydrolysing)